MNTDSKKRQRSENWLKEDKILLKEMVKERVSLLENKNTDSNTNNKKVAAWQDLLASFNAMEKTTRTMQQIKSQWCMIKMSAKKIKFAHKKEILRTGGGPPPPIESPSGDDIAVWLPNEFVIDSNEFDSDSQKLPKLDLHMQEQTDEKNIVILEPEPSTSYGVADISGSNIADTNLESTKAAKRMQR